MTDKRDNYKIQLMQAQKRFLTYDQQELISRCRLTFDEDYLYVRLLGSPYRICRRTGRMEKNQDGRWEDGNGFYEVMTVLDWLCDSRPDRYITGRWVNIVSHGNYFHGNLQEKDDPVAERFCNNPDRFRRACLSLGGEEQPGADISYGVELIDGLKILIQLWYSDEEFPARLRFLWDENTTRYIRYETTWYAVALLQQQLQEQMESE